MKLKNRNLETKTKKSDFTSPSLHLFLEKFNREDERTGREERERQRERDRETESERGKEEEERQREGHLI